MGNKKKYTPNPKGNSESIKQYQFKPGQSGNPQGARRKKPLDLPKAYAHYLKQVDPETGKTHAELIAQQVIQRAVSGDVASLMLAVSNDAEELVRKAIDKLRKEHKCSVWQAKLALSLFLPERMIP